MPRSLFATIASLILVASYSPESTANDIVDFLRAIQGRSHAHHHDVVVHPAGNRHDRHGHGNYLPSGFSGIDHSRRDYGSRRSVYVPGRRATVSFNFSSSRPGRTVSRPIVSHVPPTLEVAPPPRFLTSSAHEIGSFVTCPVTLATHVEIHDVHEMAPHAVPVVVAVRDPSLGHWGSPGCIENVVYVEVFVPPCPLEKLTVSPCMTKIRLDYGTYEVDITSRRGLIEIDYDN